MAKRMRESAPTQITIRMRIWAARIVAPLAGETEDEKFNFHRFFICCHFFLVVFFLFCLFIPWDMVRFATICVEFHSADLFPCGFSAMAPPLFPSPLHARQCNQDWASAITFAEQTKTNCGQQNTWKKRIESHILFRARLNWIYSANFYLLLLLLYSAQRRKGKLRMPVCDNRVCSTLWGPPLIQSIIFYTRNEWILSRGKRGEEYTS